jgi:hemerythrin-like domain-containing protein
MQAIRIIVDEHRSLAAVMHAMLGSIREVRLCGSTPNFAMFEAMVNYLDTFVERLHHPKEEAYLFIMLRLRYPDCTTLIDRLLAEHREGSVKLRLLQPALERYRQGEPDAFASFAQAAQAYAAFHWNHMRAEDEQLLPLARRYFSEADWKAIEEAYGDHGDPMLALPAQECDALFRSIVALGAARLDQPSRGTTRRPA